MKSTPRREQLVASPGIQVAEKIRVLCIDSNDDDAERCLSALLRDGILVDARCAQDESTLRVVLESFVPDIVLSEFDFPHFDGYAAQQIVRDAFPDVPLIFVSDTITEERAAIALQSGAADYVVKANVSRLPSAARRAVRTHRRQVAVDERARVHAARMENLWRITNEPSLRGQARLAAMLLQAAADIWAGPTFLALVYRLEGDGAIVLGSAGAPNFPEPVAYETRALVEISSMLEYGRSFAWGDVRACEDVPPAVLQTRWRAVICTHFELHEARYCLTFASTEPATAAFGDDDFAYLDALSASLANHIHISALEESLRDEERRSRLHGQRLESSWKIVNDPTLEDESKWLAMLAHGAASIWPGDGFRGMLWRIAGTEMVLEAAAESPGHCLKAPPMSIGTVLPIAGTIVAEVLADGSGTRSWSDIQLSADIPAFARLEGARSSVIATFTAGDSIWALAFISGCLPSKPLGALEHAYLEVLVSFFSNHVHQRWQFDRITYQEEHDELTGLLNRSQFRSQTATASRTSGSYAILIVDINAFHEINEAYGSTVGDAILVEIGNVLRKSSNPHDIVGRIGSDVFAVYIPEPESLEFLHARARGVASLFTLPFSVGTGKDVVARNASIGGATAPADGQTIDAILSHADAALAIAKERGHGSIVFYEPGMERDAHARARLRNELAAALALDQFTLYFQPHVELETGRIAGCEALIRWNHPVRGLVPPGQFIPFAEEVGIINRIDEWVMRRAFDTVTELSANRPEFRLYFNLSGRQAGNPKIVRLFVEAARRGVPLKNIGIEITESDAMRDVESTHRVFRALRRLNVSIAIDDFGTGYSSLSSLRRLPVDIVKIDRSFVAGVIKNADDAAIAQTIVSISDHFGFESLGEGAEEPGEVEWLRRHGCRYVQGYAICRPLPLQDVMEWLACQDVLKGTCAKLS